MANDGDIETWRSDRGELAVAFRAPAVLVFKYRGYMSAGAVPFVDGCVQRALKAGLRPDLFVDLRELTGYDTEYRVAITQWGRTIKDRVGLFLLLVNSKLIAMGVSVSNMILGGFMTATSRHEQFEAALAESLRKAGVAVAAESAPPPRPPV